MEKTRPDKIRQSLTGFVANNKRITDAQAIERLRRHAESLSQQLDDIFRIACNTKVRFCELRRCAECERIHVRPSSLAVNVGTGYPWMGRQLCTACLPEAMMRDGMESEPEMMTVMLENWYGAWLAMPGRCCTGDRQTNPASPIAGVEDAAQYIVGATEQLRWAKWEAGMLPARNYALESDICSAAKAVIAAEQRVIA